MAYYYITLNGDIYKTVGARYVKKIYAKSSISGKLTTGISEMIIPLPNLVSPLFFDAESIIKIQPMHSNIKNIFSMHYHFIKNIKHTRNKPGFKRVYCNRRRKRNRNTIRIEVFRSQINPIFESDDFNMILFELSMKGL